MTVLFARLSLKYKERYKEETRSFKGKSAPNLQGSLMMITSNSEKDTIAFAQTCARDSVNGDIFTLQGPLGAGKSVFCRAFIQSLMDEDTDVPSPTFTLVQSYDTSKGTIWHFDLYRIEEGQEIYEIGWEEALSDGILLIEWPERLENLLPTIRKEIIFKPISTESRNIQLIHHKEAS